MLKRPLRARCQNALRSGWANAFDAVELGLAGVIDVNFDDLGLDIVLQPALSLTGLRRMGLCADRGQIA